MTCHKRTQVDAERSINYSELGSTKQSLFIHSYASFPQIIVIWDVKLSCLSFSALPLFIIRDRLGFNDRRLQENTQYQTCEHLNDRPGSLHDV